jgi:hypothetical protein
MLKHLMNGSSLISLVLRDGNNDEGADAKAKLRAQIAGNAKVEAKSEVEIKAEAETNDGNEEDDTEGEEEDKEEEEGKEKEEDEEKVEETEEQKVEREAQEKIAAKAKRKQDRMQARIDEATAARRNAEAEVARLKAQLEADPDKKLTQEEVDSKAEAIVKQRLADKELADLQKKFDDTCAVLAKDAKKIDKDFDDKVNDMAEQFGAIPSFMIGVLGDLDNGGEVLAYLANDDDEAERIYDLTRVPAKMAKELAMISLKLEEAKKPKKKEISKVKGIDPVKSSNKSAASAVLTEADAKNMDSYVAKRIRMREDQKKARGY